MRERIEVDHAYVRQAVTWLQSAKDDEAIAVLVDDLVPYLKQHFDVEEAPDGLFAKVLQTAPRFQGVIEELRAEHGTMLGMATRVRESISKPYGKASAALLADVGELASMLKQHEQREEGMMQSALEQDLGGG